MNDVTTTIEDQIKDKLIALFKPWCDDYRDGKVQATPRYCQLDLKGFNSMTENRLYSTVDGYATYFKYDIFSEEEMNWFKDKFKYNEEEDICYEPTYVWDWWKRMRQVALLRMFDTVNP